MNWIENERAADAILKARLPQTSRKLTSEHSKAGEKYLIVCEVGVSGLRNSYPPLVRSQYVKRCFAEAVAQCVIRINVESI